MHIASFNTDIATDAQSLVWVSQMKHPDSALFNVGGYAVIKGSLDKDRLFKSIDFILEKNKPVYESYFSEVNDIGQICEKHYDDLSRIDKAREIILEWMENDMKSSFNKCKTLFKVCLFKYSINEYFWYVKSHQLLVDGYAMSLFFNEVSKVYNEEDGLKFIEKNKKVGLIETLELEKKYRESRSFVIDRDYWNQMLKLGKSDGFRSIFISNEKNNLTSIRKEVPISRGKIYNILEFCEKNNISITSYFITAIYSINFLLNNDGFVLGFPIFNRKNAEQKKMLSSFTKVLPFVLDLSSKDSFMDIMVKSKIQLREGYRHKDYLFSDIITTRKKRLYNCIFSYQKNTYLNTLEGCDVSITYLHNGEQETDINFHLLEHDEKGTLTLLIDFRKSIVNYFTQELISSGLVNLINIIDQIPDQRIGEIDLSKIFGKKQLAISRNKVIFKEEIFINLFEEIVRSNMDKTALVCEGRHITYSELNSISNKLVTFLKNNNRIAPNDVVAVLLQRDERIIISLIAIMKLRATYLPMDIEFPQHRIEYILKDSDARLIIDEEFWGKFYQKIDELSQNYLRQDYSSKDFIYLTYTSGSSGNPKGVLINNKNILDYYYGISKVTNIEECDTFGLLSTVAADLGNTVIYTSLLNGGTLHMMLEKHLSEKTDELSNLDCIKITPSHWVFLNSTGGFRNPKKCLIFGGDVLSPTITNRIIQKNKECKIYNHYGPSETTIGKLIFDVTNSIDNQQLFIGQVFGGNSVYILDKNLHIVPKGVIGEICISGNGVSDGYLNKPELTAEKFIEDPFNLGQRIYRTGDIGRMLEDGNVQFIGREDNQVKIRGYRVELGEIESCIKNVEGVKDVAVILKGGGVSGDKYIIAYFVGSDQLTSTILRKELRLKLPDYMVPSHYVRLEKLPLTTNRKVDKKKLQSLEGVEIEERNKYEAPRNKLEKDLVRVWEEILDKKNIGINDDFFDLGGHSLKATQLLNYIKKTYFISIELKDIFSNSKISKLSELIGKRPKEKQNTIRLTEEKLDYPITYAQRGIWIMSQSIEGNIAYNMPGAFKITGDINVSVLNQAFSSLIRKHEILRTIFIQNIEDKVRLKILNWNDLNFVINHFEIKDSIEKEELIKKVIDKEINTPFCLHTPPLYRAQLISLNKSEHIFIFVMHHIISDGWSVGLMIRELVSFYTHHVQQSCNDIDEDELIFQYKDYSSWQNSQIENGQFEKHRQYWKNKLYGELPVIDFPSDKIRPPVKTFNGESVSSILNADQVEKLKAINSEEGITLFMKLLAATYILIYKYTGISDVIIGSPIAGRFFEEFNNQLGMYLNNLPLRTFVNPTLTFSDFLIGVKQECLNAYEHQEYPIDKMIEDLNLERNVSRTPIFDIGIVLQNTTTQLNLKDLEVFSGHKIKPHPLLRNITSKLDITFTFREIGQKILLNIEFNNDVYSKSMIQGLRGHFSNLINDIIKNPKKEIKELDMLSNKEVENIIKINDRIPIAKLEYKSLPDLFNAQVIKYPNRIAVLCNEREITYDKLDKEANRIANFIASTIINPKTAISILMEKSIESIICFLGVIKSGHPIVIIDPSLPFERIKYMINDSQIGIVFTDKKYLSKTNKLQWEVEQLKHIVCLESEDVHYPYEKDEAILNEREIWDHIGNNSTNEIGSGGWISSYTGKEFTEKEMDEYANNALLKLKPYLNKNSKILEIGCSSGITLFKIAPLVKFYHGTDISESIVNRAVDSVKELGLENVLLEVSSAHEIEKIVDTTYDVIILNSVIQSFPSHNYLRLVLAQCVNILNNNGVIFLGDIQDINKKEDLISSLYNYKKRNKKGDFYTKLDWSQELFISKFFIEDLKYDIPYINNIIFSDKIGSIKNELTLFRFDAIIELNKVLEKEKEGDKQKQQFGAKELVKFSTFFNLLSYSKDDICYTIYTSGTTSHPKGVKVTNNNVFNLNDALSKLYQLSSFIPQLLQIANMSFDVFIGDFCRSLLSGGKMILISSKDIVDHKKMYEIICSNQINILESTPAVIIPLMKYIYENSYDISFIKIITMGADVLTIEDFQWLKETFPTTIRILNTYGTTETTVDATYYENNGEELPVIGCTPIGIPIDNYSIYILDNNLNLLPIGAIGEICISGDGVSAGYLNNSELTSEKFVEDPFKLGQKMYRTGDKGRMLKGGNIQFIGREDNQVKIRGYRVELGEVESCIRNCEGVKEVAVILKETEATDDKYIVAYYVGTDQLTSGILKEELKLKLPDYMIPNHYTRLEKLPLTTNGKIDKKKLQLIEGEEILSSREYEAPRNRLEEELVEIWEEILERKNIGITDDFFDLGGHSLKALRLQSSIHKTLGFKIELKDLFLNSNIISQTNLIENTHKHEYEEIGKLEESTDYELSSNQYRLWILSQSEQGSIAYNISEAAHFIGVIDVVIFEKAINIIIERHEILRTIFVQNEKNNVRQQVLSVKQIGKQFRFRKLKKEISINNEINLLAKQPYKLDRGPLFRIELINTYDVNYTLFIGMHHIIGDAWSMNILVNEILVVYNNLLNNDPISLNKLRVQYKDFSSWQKNIIREGKLQNQFDYWKSLLENAPETIDLLLDYERPHIKSYEGNSIKRFIDGDVFDRLQEFCKNNDSSLFIGVLAITKVLLYGITNQKDIVIGIPVSGRDHYELENQLGFYVNTIPLRTVINEEETFLSLFKKIRQNTLNAFNNQMYPFDLLVKNLGINWERNRNPLFDIMIVVRYDNKMFEGVTGLEVVKYKSFEEKSKFDLTFYFTISEGAVETRLVYNSQLFKPATIENIANRYMNMCSGLIYGGMTIKSLAKSSVSKEEYNEQLLFESMINKEIEDDF